MGRVPLSAIQSENGYNCCPFFMNKAFDSGFITLRDDMTVQVLCKQNVSNDQFYSESIANKMLDQDGLRNFT